MVAFRLVSAASDFELLDAWREGDKQAGNELFERYFEAISRFFRNKTAEAVDDLVQEVFLTCLRNRDAFRKQASFRTYLFQIARSRLYDHYRKRARSPLDFTSQSAADLGTSPSRAAARKQEHQLLLLALRSIPVDQQIALELYYWEELSGPELAQVLDISPNTVRSRLHRARKAVEEALAKLASSPHELETTLENFEGWARALKAGIGMSSHA